jgi:hypothetical protein
MTQTKAVPTAGCRPVSRLTAETNGTGTGPSRAGVKQGGGDDQKPVPAPPPVNGCARGSERMASRPSVRGRCQPDGVAVGTCRLRHAIAFAAVGFKS